MRLLVLGTSGMLGSTVFRDFDSITSFEVWGLMRNPVFLKYFSPTQQNRILTGINVLDDLALSATFNRLHPEVVINCIGLIKQRDCAEDPLLALPINAMLPHRLAALCSACNARLITIGTDCVFSGRRGMYTEADPSDAEDLYGKSKYIGEIHSHKFAVTLRTSIIGHELNSRRALVDWFLSQKGQVDGFRRSIFSGITANELSKVIREKILSDSSLYGLYHVSSAPISKFALLKLIAAQYDKPIEVLPNDKIVIDRSLDSSHLFQATGYRAPSWEHMLRLMYDKNKIES